MGLFDAMNVAATGLTGERLRMDTIAANLANANSTRRADGQPGPYLRREVVLREATPRPRPAASPSPASSSRRTARA
jgi:flagellar basal-body rod protein FlgC